MFHLPSSWSEVELSLELNKAALHQVDFLRTVYEMPALYQQSVIDAAIYRYQQLWLPLAAENAGTILAAPLDIEWVWHCHMLSPRDYLEDCTRNFNKVINHKLMSSSERKRILPIAEKFWNKKFPNQPFEICFPSGKVLSRPYRPPRGAHHVYDLSYDLEAAIQRQRSFCYQVSLPHYRDKVFLQSALKRYQKSLFLKSHNPHVPIIPFHDVALILQAHQVHPSLYQTDMQNVFNNAFRLDDDFNDPFHYQHPDQEFNELWDNLFHEPMPRAGTMFRGKPTFNFMSVLKQDDIRAALGKRVRLSSIEARVREAPDAQRKRLELWTFSNDGVIGNKPVILDCAYANYLWQAKDTDGLEFDTSVHRGLRLHMLTKPGIFQRDITLGKGTCDVLDEVTSDAHPGNPITKSITMQGKKQFQASVTFKKEDVHRIELELELRASPFDERHVSLHLGHLLNSIFTDPSVAERDARCYTAKHMLTLISGTSLFSCRVIQCPELMMSTIQLLDKDDMVVLAHLIGHDQLPRKRQVKSADNCPTLEPQTPERHEIAFVVKNKYGDWAVCVGVVEDGTQKTKDTPVIIKVFKTKSRTMTVVNVPRSLDQEGEISVDGISVDVSSGTFRVSGSLEELAEKIVLVFVVFQLHFMAVTDHTGPPAKNKPAATKNPFSLAIGAEVEIPRQHYLTEYFNQSIFSSTNEPEDLCTDAGVTQNSRGSRAARMATFMRSDTVESEGDCLESFFLHASEDNPPSYSTLIGGNQAVSAGTPDEIPRYNSPLVHSSSGSYHGSQTFYIGDCPDPVPLRADTHPPTYDSLGDLGSAVDAPPTYSTVLEWVKTLPNTESNTDEGNTTDSIQDDVLTNVVD